MGLYEFATIAFVGLVIEVFVFSFQRILAVLEITRESIPGARLLESSARYHQGFANEGSWLPKVQAGVLAFGLTVAALVALSFVTIATAFLLA